MSFFGVTRLVGVNEKRQGNGRHRRLMERARWRETPPAHGAGQVIRVRETSAAHGAGQMKRDTAGSWSGPGESTGRLAAHGAVQVKVLGDRETELAPRSEKRRY